MKKSKYIIVSLLSAMALASCSLFKDDDIVVENHFNAKGQVEEQKEAEAKIGDVESQRVDDVPNALVFKNIVYSNKEGGKIENTYTTANGFKYNVNEGADYVADKNNNNFDLYVPDGADRSKDQNVVLFIHGGAWISGLKTHVNPYVKKFASEGYIAATIEYTLLNQEMNNASLSIFRDLDEISACLSTMKKSLKELGFNESKLHLVLGGTSSGAHLAMLYAYSRGVGHVCPFDDIKFLIDVVGPTDINENVWKAFNCPDAAAYEAALDEGIEYETIEDRGAGGVQDLQVAGQTYTWNPYQTMRIANGMCGLPFTLDQVEEAGNAAKDDIADTSKEVYKSLCTDSFDGISGEKELSVTYHLGLSAKIPMICAYAGKDAVVGIAQYAALEKAMIGKSYSKGTDYDFVYFRNCGHVDLDSDETHYNELITKILNWMATK